MMITLALRYWYFLVIAALLACIGIEHIRGNSARTALYKERAEFAEVQTKAAQAALEATQENQRIANRWNANVIGAMNAAKTRESDLRTAAAGAVSELERLRIAANNRPVRRDVPSTTGTPGDQYANTERELFLECAAAFVGMAGAAGGHASDVQTLSESWPR